MSGVSDESMSIERNCEICGEEFSTEDPEQNVCNECWNEIGVEEDDE